MRLENIMVSKFNVNPDSGLIENLPYVLENVETHERQIGTLVLANEEKLVFNVWSQDEDCRLVLTPSNIESYHIYKASSKDGISIQIEDVDKYTLPSGKVLSEKDIHNIMDVINNPSKALSEQDIHSIMNVMNNPLQDTINEITSTIACNRIIDYKYQDSDKCLTTGIENFYKVDTESGVTVIKQFLYKVSFLKDRDLVQYAIMLPASEKDKREYIEKGWKIHPMFYNKKNDRYMNRVILGKKHAIDFAHKEQDSITIQILSGLQMLYLVEFGLNQNPNLECSMYAGIQYDGGYIVISNAYVDERNQLVIDDEIESILVYSDFGYISKFVYWNGECDWLFLPKETTDTPTLTDSFFTGPSRNRKSIILWGDDDSNAGIFRLWMNSTSTTGGEHIVTWEFGE